MFGIPHQRREEFDRAALVHVPELLRVAARLCGSADAGEDLLQETYLQAWRSFHRFEAGTNCRAWLYKILLFTYSAQNRKRARQPFLVDLDAAGEAALLVDVPTPDTLTAEAVKAAGSTDGAAVAKALEDGKFKLLTGDLDYGTAEEGHVPNKAAVIVELKGGKPSFVGWRLPESLPAP